MWDKGGDQAVWTTPSHESDRQVDFKQSDKSSGQISPLTSSVRVALACVVFEEPVAIRAQGTKNGEVEIWI